MLIIKKYANGRLYDSVNKEYVTRDELSEMINGKEKIKVILAKTGKDITKSVLSSLPAAKQASKNGNKQSLFKKVAAKTRVDDHKKWIEKQIDKTMDAVLEMMNFPNKRQVVKLNTDVKKLAKKVEDLQKRQAQHNLKMKREHKKELETLAKQYDLRLQRVEAAPAAQGA